LVVGDKLQGYLNKFKTIDDFRVDEPEMCEQKNENVQNNAGSSCNSKQQQQQGGKKRQRSTSDNDTTAQKVDATPASVHEV
jgi:hypothetical protein